MEVWKDVPNYEGIYQVSNYGNVKSLGRVLKNRWGNYFKSERLITPKKNSGGYLWVKLCNGKEDCRAVHRLVMLCFVGDSNLIVNHIDSNKENNNLDNLEYCQHRENITHYAKTAKSTSKYMGVSWDSTRKKWSSKIKVNGKTVNLGRFENELDAYHKYIDYAKSKGLSTANC
jgi:hypothetical protein